MTFSDKIKLVTKGTPLVTKYNLSLTEKSFKVYSESKFMKDDDMNPFARSSKRFFGHFHGDYGREFSIKPKSSFYKKGSMSNTIWIHGKFTPKEEQLISLEVTYHRTNFAKYGQWILVGSIGFIFLTNSIRTLGNYDFVSLSIFGGVLILFYLIGTLIRVAQTNRQIEYFEKYFIDEIQKKH